MIRQVTIQQAYWTVTSSLMPGTATGRLAVAPSILRPALHYAYFLTERGLWRDFTPVSMAGPALRRTRLTTGMEGTVSQETISNHIGVSPVGEADLTNTGFW